MRGTMVHILIDTDKGISEIIQDILTMPNEKYYLEIHLAENYEILSLILFDLGMNIGKFIEILEFAARKYRELTDVKFNSLSDSLINISHELRRQKMIFPENLFRLDTE